MRFFIIFILSFHISHVNADEIYNLLKIPNLEIYKLKNDNKIRYLNAKSDFKIGVDYNISCNQASKLNLENKCKWRNLYFHTSNAVNKLYQCFELNNNNKKGGMLFHGSMYKFLDGYSMNGLWLNTLTSFTTLKRIAISYVLSIPHIFFCK